MLYSVYKYMNIWFVIYFILYYVSRLFYLCFSSILELFHVSEKIALIQNVAPIEKYYSNNLVYIVIVHIKKKQMNKKNLNMLNTTWPNIYATDRANLLKLKRILFHIICSIKYFTNRMFELLYMSLSILLIYLVTLWKK